MDDYLTLIWIKDNEYQIYSDSEGKGLAECLRYDADAKLFRRENGQAYTDDGCRQPSDPYLTRVRVVEGQPLQISELIVAVNKCLPDLEAHVATGTAQARQRLIELKTILRKIKQVNLFGGHLT